MARKFRWVTIEGRKILAEVRRLPGQDFLWLVKPKLVKKGSPRTFVCSLSIVKRKKKAPKRGRKSRR